jgi:uncharacterized protein
LRTAVLWWKACSVFEPDYFVDYLADSPWIRQPFEVYDDLDPATLEKRLSSPSTEAVAGKRTPAAQVAVRATDPVKDG